MPHLGAAAGKGTLGQNMELGQMHHEMVGSPGSPKRLRILANPDRWAFVIRKNCLVIYW